MAKAGGWGEARPAKPVKSVRWTDLSAERRFRVLGPDDKLQVGDVMTNGHHVGIYVPGPHGEDMTVSAAASRKDDAVVHNRWGFAVTKAR
jgi:hypothetical protein